MEAFKVIGAILLICLIVVLGPLAVIWALNILFPVLNIAYTGWTWLAALILMGVFNSSVKKSNN